MSAANVMRVKVVDASAIAALLRRKRGGEYSMNADYKFNVQSGDVIRQFDRAILATGLGVSHRLEILFVPTNAHAGANQGAAE